MRAIASQIASPTIVCSTFYSGISQRKHQSSASLTFVWGVHRWPMSSPHKWPVMGKMFPFDDVIMWWAHVCYVQNGDCAGDDCLGGKCPTTTVAVRDLVIGVVHIDRVLLCLCIHLLWSWLISENNDNCNICGNLCVLQSWHQQLWSEGTEAIYLIIGHIISLKMQVLLCGMCKIISVVIL